MKAKNTGAGVPKTRLDYTDAMLLLEVEGLARDGFDDQQIAEILDVAPETFSKNKNKKQADGSPSLLSAALARGRRPLSVLVENSLYKRAMGHTVKTVTTKDKWMRVDGKLQKFTDVTEIVTELPGDVHAQMFWLKTHKPDVYNIQPERVDLTSAGEKIKNDAPRVGKIEHVIISIDQVKKQDVDQVA